MLVERTHRSLFYGICQVSAFTANIPGARGFSSGTAAAGPAACAVAEYSAAAEFSCAVSEASEAALDYCVPAWIMGALVTIVATLLAFGYWRCARRAAPLALRNVVKATADLGIQVERQDFDGLLSLIHI